jgi:hypothetical protein
MTEQLRMAEISGEWPEQDLEWLGRCPARDASDRTILEENLEDLAFGAAPGAWLTIIDAGGALYGAFSGFLGEGRMEFMEPIAQDVWALPCWRALDHTPPGDWTMHAGRDGAGQIEGITVGCWLARGFDYRPLAR